MFSPWRDVEKLRQLTPDQRKKALDALRAEMDTLRGLMSEERAARLQVPVHHKLFSSVLLTPAAP